MLESLRGVVIACERDAVVVEVSGFALRLRTPKGAAEPLCPGEEARLFCHLLLRDDQFHLFGFREKTERDMFIVLLGVPGLGPEKALAVLGARSPQAIVAAVQDESPKHFEIIKGIGARLSQRIVLELKGKLDALALGFPAGAASLDAGGPLADLISTLGRLGYARAVAEAAARAALAGAAPDESLEELVKSALRSLQRQATS
ncbi:MAG: Holliday junction branch migration protein RuvA [Planctomycetes bacterium]|nr:Holliday junction branch migration protein RuvA [Planctomycetota bacterium]